MRSLSVRPMCGAFLIFLGLLTACDKHSPTQPNLDSSPSQPGSVQPPSLVDLRVDGPASLPPGESAQYTATARFSDGTSRDVTAEARWTSTDASVLSVNSMGLASARSNGTGYVHGEFGARSHVREVIVVPAGTYVMRAFVSEDQITATIYGAKVEVTSGPAAGLAAFTDWNGIATLYGVPAEAELRFTKDGYNPIVTSVHVDHNWSDVWVQLLSSDGRLDLAGKYALTIKAGACMDGGALPESVTTRTYSARIRNTGAKVVVELDGDGFVIEWCPLCHESRGNWFGGQPAARDARFTLNEYTAPEDWNGGTYPNVVERRPEGLLTIAGHAIVTPSPQGFSGTLDGTIALYSALDLTYAGSRPLAVCRSTNHQVTLLR